MCVNTHPNVGRGCPPGVYWPGCNDAEGLGVWWWEHVINIDDGSASLSHTEDRYPTPVNKSLCLLKKKNSVPSYDTMQTDCMYSSACVLYFGYIMTMTMCICCPYLTDWWIVSQQWFTVMSMRPWNIQPELRSRMFLFHSVLLYHSIIITMFSIAIPLLSLVVV